MLCCIKAFDILVELMHDITATIISDPRDHEVLGIMMALKEAEENRC